MTNELQCEHVLHAEVEITWVANFEMGLQSPHREKLLTCAVEVCC